MNAAEQRFRAQYAKYVRGTGRFPACRTLDRARLRELMADVDAELLADAEATFPRAMKLARELGAAAFHRGARRVPALDPRLGELRPHLNVQTLDAWLAAWDHENIHTDGPRNAASEA